MRGALECAAAAIGSLPFVRRVLVAIDGVDGAGKTTFADLLAPLVGRPVVRASADDFHNPRALRYRLGRDSAEGFFRDAFDVPALVHRLLDPFERREPFRRQIFNHRANAPVVSLDENAPADAVLLLDGIFLHREELRGRWDLSILLNVWPAVAAERFSKRDGRPPASRYVRGQEIYFMRCDPGAHASLVLDW